MSEALHTVVGSTGAVGRALLRQLSARNSAVSIRTVSRSASTAPNHVTASCLDRQAIIDACRGSAVVYLVIGLKYDKKVWKRDWPVVISNVLEACKQAGATLVFADNLYCYGDVGTAQLSPTLPYTTSTKSAKSLVRADVARTIESSGVPYVIVRGSDFYGADCTDVSHFGDYVVPPLLKGGTAKFVVEPHRWKHSLTHTNDFARALVVAATDPRALNRAWHVPCAPAKTFGEYAQMIAEAVHESGGPPPAKTTSALLMPAFALSVMSHFVGFLGELRDMQHVWDRDYIVDDRAFLETFGAKFGSPTELSVGFRALVDAYRANEEAKAPA